MSELSIETTPIPGLLVVRLPVHGDARGWFKENWQRERMTALGLPELTPVQQNISYNAARGATRGIHAEPWDKYVAVGNGRVFAAWVDLREGASFGRSFSIEIDPGVAVYVPRGVGNSYQALEDHTSYSYLVNAHYRPGVTYPALDLADPSVAIDWPIPLVEAEISAKDRANPTLDQVMPMQPRVLILGAGGQVGRALAQAYPDAVLTARVADPERAVAGLDLADSDQVEAWDWGSYDVVLNAAAFTGVDAAETDRRADAWALNAALPARLARLSDTYGFTLVHYSTDYVYDGRTKLHHEDEPVAPLGVYGQTKAAGDLAVAGAARHYVLRTSWVVGQGHNFVATMASLAERGVAPQVVADQYGRPSFADELARATRHLLETGAGYGTYHCTGGGEESTWAEVARAVFAACGREPGDVGETSTAQYAADQAAAGRVMAPRPQHGTLALDKIEATGFVPRDWRESLAEYLKRR